MTEQSPVWCPERRIAYIDGDIVAYSCAWVADRAPRKSAALAAARTMVTNIIETLSLDAGEIILTMPNAQTFRKDLSDTYKATRKQAKPQYFGDCFEYLVKQWKATVVEDIEADDALGIAMTQNPDGVVCTIDKDLNQIPGWHYNWRKFSMYHVDAEQGERFLWEQMLIGDTADNILGVRGIGPKKAKVILDESDNYADTVLELYAEKGGGWDEFTLNYKLLKILTDPGLEENWVELKGLHDDGIIRTVPTNTTSSD